jgi:hypothetical protein
VATGFSDKSDAQTKASASDRKVDTGFSDKSDAQTKAGAALLAGDRTMRYNDAGAEPAFSCR